MIERTMINSYIAKLNTKKLCIFLTGDAYAPYATCMATLLIAAACVYTEVASKKKREAEEIKSKVKPRTIWDKPDIIDVTAKSLTLRWKPSSVPQYAVEVGRRIAHLHRMHIAAN